LGVKRRDLSPKIGDFSNSARYFGGRGPKSSISVAKGGKGAPVGSSDFGA
jgi:hypothetical protein